MKILFVAMPFSIHTTRWIKQLENSGHEIHFFSSFPYADLHPELANIHYHEYFHAIRSDRSKALTYHPIKWYELNISSSLLGKYYGKLFRFFKLEKSREEVLRNLVQKIKPDIIHTLETQHAGYQVAEVKKKWKGKFPLWIHSNWGIDLHFFGKLEKHIPLIKKTLALVDVFIAEGKRDEKLAQDFGFKKEVYTFPSVGGGFEIEPLPQIKTSLRKKILIKGTQDIVRRNLSALRALERCVDILEDYEIIMYSSNDITQAAAETFYSRTNKKITVLDQISHSEMMQLNAEARLNIAVNMSDGLPNSMLEAMLTGTFPIQSNTSLADEWIVHEKTGLLVPPEDPDIIELNIRKAIRDDRMVDNAASLNHSLIKEKLDYKNIQQQVIKMYRETLKASAKGIVKEFTS